MELPCTMYIHVWKSRGNFNAVTTVDVHSGVEMEEISMWAFNWDISVNDFLMVLHWLKSYPTWDAGAAEHKLLTDT
ncbi:hypothetical protein PROFUN_16291 [Planoprotostelium fungivorum]|uniref:Uncharacterized protein n=1 Tax=Planoprotostelium fungivorum TaxID=1890364 RepID=A0A2P6MRA2_9EUKA|nr:hypothetical protein PROFUN_16291 [Planoprotostelium fungivorum]